MPKNHPEKSESYFLAIESSGRIGSVAIAKGPNLIEEIVFSGKMRHSSELFPALMKLLSRAGCTPADIQTLCFTAGPGSFTGLRIAVTTAKMLNFVKKTPLVAVDTLDVIAQNATEYIDKTGINITKIVPILDAKQNQFFAAGYQSQNNKWVKQFEDTLIRTDVLIKQMNQDPEEPYWVLGEGLLYHSDLFTTQNVRLLPPEYWPARARNVLKIGHDMALRNKFADPLTLVPAYIRRPDALEKGGDKKHP